MTTSVGSIHTCFYSLAVAKTHSALSPTFTAEMCFQGWPPALGGSLDPERMVGGNHLEIRWPLGKVSTVTPWTDFLRMPAFKNQNEYPEITTLLRWEIPDLMALDVKMTIWKGSKNCWKSAFNNDLHALWEYAGAEVGVRRWEVHWLSPLLSARLSLVPSCENSPCSLPSWAWVLVRWLVLISPLSKLSQSVSTYLALGGASYWNA